MDAYLSAILLNADVLCCREPHVEADVSSIIAEDVTCIAKDKTHMKGQCAESNAQAAVESTCAVGAKACSKRTNTVQRGAVSADASDQKDCVGRRKKKREAVVSGIDNKTTSSNDADASSDADYCTLALRHFRTKEVAMNRMINATYMNSQTDINSKFRSILVDWLVEVRVKFKLRRHTLFLTVNYIDRFLTRNIICRSKLQLVGITALFIAAKCEEIYSFALNDLLHVSARAYTRNEVLDMEIRMLAALSYDMYAPTPRVFVKAFARGVHCSIAELATYYLECCLISYDILPYLPSALATAALHLAIRAMPTEASPSDASKLWEVTGYTIVDLRRCIYTMHTILRTAPQSQFQAVRKQKRYAEIKDKLSVSCT
jgi:hypothetical protein